MVRAGCLLAVFFLGWLLPAGAFPAAQDKEKPAGKENPELRKPDVEYEPTPRDIVLAMLKLAKVKKGELVYDLGCGDGRIVIAAAKKYGARGVGYELDPKMVKRARRNVRKAGVGRLVKIVHKDIFTLDLSKADVVCLYLLPELNIKLLPQLRKMKRGARIVSNSWDIKGVPADKQIYVKGKVWGDWDLFLWVAPLK
jgi:SAM-dependent methyltransferase